MKASGQDSKALSLGIARRKSVKGKVWEVHFERVLVSLSQGCFPEEMGDKDGGTDEPWGIPPLCPNSTGDLEWEAPVPEPEFQLASLPPLCPPP